MTSILPVPKKSLFGNTSIVITGIIKAPVQIASTQQGLSYCYYLRAWPFMRTTFEVSKVLSFSIKGTFILTSTYFQNSLVKFSGAFLCILELVMIAFAISGLLDFLGSHRTTASSSQ
jgi:hypothetical protein